MFNLVITDSDRFELIVQEMEVIIPKIEDIFNDETNVFEMINDTDIWSGETQQVIYQKYQQLAKNYDPIKESLYNYIKFLKITLDNYKKFENSLNNTIDSNDDSFNVN